MSLALPVYNGALYLERVLESALAQTFVDFELIISDNASTDETQQICERYAKRDHRIVYLRNASNVGLAKNHNLTVAHARGDYFKWLSHDDECLPGMLQRCVDALDAAPPSVAMVYTAVELIDERGNSMGIASDAVASANSRPARRLIAFLRNLSLYTFCFGMMRTEILRKTRLYGLFPKSDSVLFAELAMLGELREIPEPLYRLRIHSGRSLRAHTTEQARRALFDPKREGRRACLSIDNEVFIETLIGAWRTPLRLHDKILCTFVALTVPAWIRLRGLGTKREPSGM